MYTRTLILTLLIFSLLGLKLGNAQQKYNEVYRVADHIIDNTSFKIINKQTGELFDNTKKLPFSADYKVESPYNEWKYWNGVLAISMIELGKVSQQEKYTEYAKKNYEFIFNNLDYFETLYEQKIRKSSFHLYFRMSRLDDCGAMAMGLCDVYNLNPQKEYMQYLKRTANFIENEEVRMDDKTIVRPKPRKMTLWADDLYMSVPFLVRMAKLTGEEKYMNDALLLVENFNKYLYNPENGLYFHSWYSDNEQNGVAHWGRCNGWVIMAQVELLSYLPENHPKRTKILGFLEDHIAGLARHQDYTGLWHQLINKPDSYLESSATAMFVYSVAKAINKGWISSTYAGIATAGWSGLRTNITEDGQVEAICVGTGIEDNNKFYYERPTKVNDIHGLGAVILAGVEMIKLDELLVAEKKEKLRSKMAKLKD